MESTDGWTLCEQNCRCDPCTKRDVIPEIDGVSKRDKVAKVDVAKRQGGLSFWAAFALANPCDCDDNFSFCILSNEGAIPW